MISPQFGRAAFRIAITMVSISAIMVFVLAPGSAEYWISVITLVLGLLFVGMIFILVRILQ